ncbi:MAG: hypothetical protein M9899_01070 [Bdellovibrionaceae bacterium]|nr:hypothetical protein [Pseudobdellovibrionaceae bacterium]
MGTDFKNLATPRDFFAELIQDAAKAVSRSDFHPLSYSYLSELLVDFLHVEKLYGAEGSGSKMMAEQWFESQACDLNAKIVRLKRLGDTSLYVAGFFASSFKRKVINQSYYIQMGEMSFQSLSKIVSEPEFENVYSHFSSHFPSYVDILTEVSQKVNIQKSGDILNLFERYIDSGSKWAEKQLLSEGILTYPLKKTSN